MILKTLPRLTLLVAATSISISTVPAFAGVADARYDLQYYLDFSYNKGMFAAGATNISVYFKDGTKVANPEIPLMPNLDSYAQVGTYLNIPGSAGFNGVGGVGLVAPQYVMGAMHCGERTAYFLTENNYNTAYTSSGYKAASTVHIDWSIQRLNKIVTEVAYTPFADDAFMSKLKTGDWLYRLGHGSYANTSGETLQTNDKALGGLINISQIKKLDANTWEILSHNRENDTSADVRPPMEIGALHGDSGSPVYAWDAENKRFVQAFFASAAYTYKSHSNVIFSRYNANETSAFIDSCTVKAADFKGAEKIVWSTQDATAGTGTLTQGDVSVEYVGSGSGNTVYAHKGITFSTTDSENTQVLELQGSVNMGAGAMTFDSGDWKLTETSPDFTFNSAGFVVNKGASLTLELTGTSSEEWRKVGEGTLTIAGSGNNDVVLRVGGGTTVYDVTRDESGNITGCTLGNAGETRLNRTDGYAASSVRLEAGVAIIVLMQDGQFKTNSVAGDTFTFGNAGGLLNLNGHELSWGVINQDGSGTGARIGNFTPLDETATPKTATFTYTGTGTFEGCFMDEGTSGAQLAVVYENDATDATWTLTGNHSNVGGFIVNAGTMILQGTNTPHVNITDANDWTYASLEGSDVSVKSGATFRLSHHALMSGNVNVEDGGTFEMNQTVNAASESVVGSLRQDVTNLVSLKGNVNLISANSTMRVATDSVVAVNYGGVISGVGNFEKTGAGTLKLSGANTFTGTRTIKQGVIEFENTNALGGNAETTKWKVEKDGVLGISGVGGNALKYVDESSTGVLALGADETSQIGLTNGTTLSHNNLFVGAMSGETITYGDKNTELKANTENKWLLGGGGGTLNVEFKLTGGNSLIVGNENSSGTVHLKNEANDFSGDIIIGGFNNILTYENISALGSGRISVSYGNELCVFHGSGEILNAIKSESNGVLALCGENGSGRVSQNIDLKNAAYGTTAVGAVGEVRYTGTFTPDTTGNYNFGGSGTLILETNLTGAGTLNVDGQGLSGGKVVFAKESDFSGAVVVGGVLKTDSNLEAGTVSVGFEAENALAKVASVTLKKGAVLDLSDGDARVNNLTTETGAQLANNGAEERTLTLSNSSDTTLAAGTLGGGTNRMNVVKTGSGTLTLAANNNFQGTFTVNEGKVIAKSDSKTSSSFGTGDSKNNIVLGNGGTLEVTFAKDETRTGFSKTQCFQTVTGTGTIIAKSGGNILLLEQSEKFNGRVVITGDTRLFIGSGLADNSMIKHSNIAAFNGATVVVESGSQVRVTNRLSNWGAYGVAAVQNSYANYEISGEGISRSVNTTNMPCNVNGKGALSVDCASVIHGTITLGGNSSLASWSQSYGTNTVAGYGTGQWIGGTIRGAISGEHVLTLYGNQGLTFKADAQSNYGSLTLAQNWNGNATYCPWALRVGLGEAKDTVSTALGNGTVTINAGQSNNILTLRFDNAGTEDAGITYTYNNNFSVAKGKLESAYNTTRITGTVAMTGDTLNLETKNGSELRLEGGISGSGATVGITDGSTIALGGNTTGFGGTINANSATNLTLLASAANETALGSDVTLNFTDSLNLNLEGAGTFTFGTIVGTASSADAGLALLSADGTTGTVLNLDCDFTSGTAGSQLSASTFTVNNVSVSLSLNGTEDLAKGTYTIFSGDTNGTAFTLENSGLSSDLAKRVKLETASDSVKLVVADDTRLFRRHDESNKIWDKTSEHWTSDAGTEIFSNGASVVFGKDGVATNNSAASREAMTINETLSASSVLVKDGTFYTFDGSGSLSVSEKLNVYGASLELKNAGTNTFAAVTIGGDSAEKAGELIASAANVLNNSAVELNENATLTLGASGALAGTSTVTFNGGTLKYGASGVGDVSSCLRAGTGNLTIDLNGQTETLSSLSAFSASAMNFSNSSETAGTVTLGASSAAFAVSAGSAINVGEKASVKHYASGTLGKLSGAGIYEIDGTAGMTLSAISNFSGTLVKSGSGTTTISSDFALENLTVNAGTFKLVNNGEKSGTTKILKNVTLSGGVLQTHNGAQPTAATVIGKLTLSGASAELNTTNFQGYWQVRELASSGNGVNGTLTLSSGHSATVRSIFELGGSENSGEPGGAFSGTIALKSTASGNHRSASLVVSDSDIAKSAKIDLSACASGSGVLSLGVNAEKVTIAGLSSTLGTAKAKVYSGKVGTKTTDGNGGSNGITKTAYGDGTTRTLEIRTAAGTNTSFNGEILANISLVKTGEGTQTLAGASAAFDGGVSVVAGTLVAAHANALGIGAISVESGATLQAAAAITLSAATQTLTLVVGESQIAPSVAGVPDAASPVGLRAISATGTPLVNSENGGKISVFDAAIVYVDVSALANSQNPPTESFALKLAAESALEFNAASARVGWWDESGAWSDWAQAYNRSYDSDSGLMTISIPEPSAFGLLAGLGVLALVASRRKRREK